MSLKGDVRDYQSISNALGGVDYVFAAAALKQVPSCEFFPMEAVRTNVIGTDNVLQAAVQHGIKKVICLSTDKAVYPINAMGISKAMMEAGGYCGSGSPRGRQVRDRQMPKTRRASPARKRCAFAAHMVARLPQGGA